MNGTIKLVLVANVILMMQIVVGVVLVVNVVVGMIGTILINWLLMLLLRY